MSELREIIASFFIFKTYHELQNAIKHIQVTYFYYIKC